MKQILTVMFFVLAIIELSAQVPLEGEITSDQTLSASDTYLLKGFVRVQAGAVLTIEPGTVIYGENASQGTLIVKPGGKIIAEGTQENPIVFTSEFNREGSSKSPSYGDWGGIIILGNAPINVPGGTALIEGPGDLYGGSAVNDSSGILKYVRVEYPGIAFSPNNEINGITFGGVGNGTTVEYIQVSYSGDDSFEFFGGNVNCKYLIAYRGWDDDFDTDFGYNGKLQFLLGIRDPQIADVSGSNGFESDNDGSGSVNEPRTAPTWWNVTLIGPLADTSTQINSNFKRGMHLRRSSQNKVNNALIMGFPTGVLIDGSTTIADAIAGNTFLNNSIISGSSKAIDTLKTNGSFDVSNWFASTYNGRIYADNSEILLTDPFNIDNPNPFPQIGSPVYSNAAVPPNDGFFDTTANYAGALGRENWTKDWSTLISVVSDVENNGSIIPSGFSLKQNYPNPFNPSTNIEFHIAQQGFVSLKIFDISGREVGLLINEELSVGKYKYEWNSGGLAAGVYFYRLQAKDFIQTKKLILLK